MKNYFILLITVSLLVFYGCGSAEFNEVKVKGQYSVEIPDYLTAATGLNDQASLQYQNEVREVYVIITDETKSDLKSQGIEFNLDTYFEFGQNNFYDGLVNSQKSEKKAVTVNGLKGYQSEITGEYNGQQIFFIYTAIESETHFYQLATWAMKSAKSEYEKDMTKIINSFKEIKK